MSPLGGLAQRFSHSVTVNGLVQRGDKVAVAFSGGADSVALLHLFQQFSQRLGIEVMAVHVNHRLRGMEAERDARFAADFAAKLGVECVVTDIDVTSHAEAHGLSVEMAARELRYAALESVAGRYGAARIATAHHKDDLVETMFLRMFKGCGVSALASVPVRRGNIIRPLLDASKSEILAYVADEGLEYVTDSTNLESGTERNFVRNELIPLVVSRFPAAVEKMAELAAIAREEESVWEELTSGLPFRVEDGALVFPKAAFEYPAPVARRFVRSVIGERIAPGFNVNRALFEEMTAAMSGPGRSRRVYDDGKVEIVATPEAIWVERVDKNFMKSVRYVKLLSDLSVSFAFRLFSFGRAVYGGEKAGPGSFCFDPRDLEEVTLRHWKAGDRIGIGRGYKKLQDYFTDEKFNLHEKRGAVVVEGGGKVVAVAAAGRVPRVAREFYAESGRPCWKVTVSAIAGEQL